MAAVATSASSRPPGAHLANSHGANTLPRRGLAHLVSKFETLDKANGAALGKPSAAGLTASKTMSSLASLQDNRCRLEDTPYRKDVVFGSSGSSLVAPAAVALGRASISAKKPEVALPNKLNHSERISVTVAEKRKIFETGGPSLKDRSSPNKQITKLPKTVTATLSRSEKSDRKISTSNSCGHLYSTPKTAPNSPTQSNLALASLQHSQPQHRQKLQNSSIHSVPASSFVLRVHRDADPQSPTRDAELPRASKVDAVTPSSPRKTHVSATGSPLKSPTKLNSKTVHALSKDLSPLSSPIKAAAHLPSTTTPNYTPAQTKRHSASSITPTASLNSIDSVIVTKRGQSVPQLLKGWSPQRIVTPQKPMAPIKAATIEQNAGRGMFMKPKNPKNFRHALGFFEAMSHRESFNSAAPSETAERPTKGPQQAKPASKREKIKSSMRNISSSWRVNRARTTGEPETVSGYPAMWKLGSVEAAPRKRLHAEWCEVSTDDRQPLIASKKGDISLFDPYLASHAKVYRGEEHTHGHVNISLQQSSLHGNFYDADESDCGANNTSEDCSRSPDHDSSKALKPPRGSSRRWFSRSSGALISQAHCRLEQPRPVYGVEMKRLISLCKLQGSLKRRGHTE